MVYMAMAAFVELQRAVVIHATAYIPQRYAPAFLKHCSHKLHHNICISILI
jgi:hypothetical protein